MSSSSVIDFIVHDDTSNQSIEIPDPPALNVTHISTTNPSDSDDDDAIPSQQFNKIFIHHTKTDSEPIGDSSSALFPSRP